MTKYVQFIKKYKKVLFLFLIIVNITAFIGLFKIELNTNFSIFSKDNSKYEVYLEEIQEVFGELNQIVILVEHDELNEDVISDLRDLQVFLENTNNVEGVQGVAPESILINGKPTNILDINPQVLEGYYSRFEEYSPLVINDTYYSTFTVFLNKDFGKDEINNIEEYLEELEYKNYISGDLYNQLKIVDYIISILMVLPPLALVLILAVFRSQMKSIKATILSVLPAAMGALWTMGSIGWIGNQVSLLTAIVPVFIIVIGSADGLHFMSHIQDSTKEGYDTETSVANTLKMVGIPMIITTITSMAGFLALLSMNTSSIYELSIFSAVGILFAGIATWFVLPLIIVNKNINVVGKNISNKDGLNTYLKRLWGKPAYIIIVLILVITSFSYKNINNEFNMLMVYKDYTVVRENADKINEISGGSIPLYVTVKLDASPIDIESMHEVNNYSNRLKDSGYVNKIVNPYELFNIVSKMKDPSGIKNNIALNMVYQSLKQDSNTVSNLISNEEKIVRLLVFPKNLDNLTLNEIEKVVSDFDNAYVTGVQYLMKDLNEDISKMQFDSIVLALGIVLALLFISLRSFKIALISLVPITLTIISLYGFLGVSSIPLNITTTMIFSITIGVGIDYAVHFSSVYKSYYNELNDSEESVSKAYKYTSRPVIANALGISIGLSILMLSPLKIHFNVSTLMWISMIVSVIMTLTILPMILKKSN